METNKDNSGFDYNRDAVIESSNGMVTNRYGWNEYDQPDAPACEISWRNQEDAWDAIMDGEYIPEDW